MTVNLTRVLAVILLIASFSACKKKHEDSIVDIKKKFNTINSKLSDYTRRQVDDLTTKAGGTITGYYRDEEVKKIYSERFTDKDRAFTEYYFDDGMLIYVLKQEYVYNRPTYYNEEMAKQNADSVWYDDKKTRLDISRFYLSDHKLIKWIGPAGMDVAVNDPKFHQKQEELLAETIIMLKQLNEQ
ncbi:MAG: hypothetical protein V4649_03505 [Bacteroidota bacterium]